MEFEWDDNKNKANIEKHGIAFEEAALIFQGITLTRRDDRQNYGEAREITIGSLPEQVIVVVVHTDRNGVTRLISARLPNREERSLYNDYYKKITQ